MSEELRALVARANARGGDPSLRAIVDTANQRAQSSGGTLSDVVKAAGSGLARGITGLPDLAGMTSRPTTYAIEKIGEAITGETPRVGGMTPGEIANRYLPFGGGTRYTDAATALAPDVMGYEPETRAGKFAQTVGEFVPGAAAGGAAMGASVPASIARFGLIPGMASEAAGQATEGTAWEAPARLGAAVVAGSPRSIGTRPRKVAEGIDDSVRFLEGQGVRLSAGQRADDIALKGREQATQAGKALQDQALDDFTKTVLGRIRGQGNRWDRGNLDATGKRIGQMFDDVAGRTTIQADTQLAAGVRGAIDDVDSAPKSLRDIADAIEDMATRPGGGTIDGATYQRWASIAGKASKSGNPNTREAAIGIRGALDDALQRYASGDDVAKLGTARELYRDLLIVERAATSAGATGGKIPPAALRGAAKSVLGNRAYVGGRSDMSELARHGANIMPGPYGPEAATRNQGILDTMIGGGVGASLGGMVGMPGVGGALGAAAGPRIANRAIASSPGQALLKGQPYIDPRLLLDAEVSRR